MNEQDIFKLKDMFHKDHRQNFFDSVNQWTHMDELGRTVHENNYQAHPVFANSIRYKLVEKGMVNFDF